MKILIIDDKEDARYLLETILQNKGYNVITAINGKDALSKMESTDFDLIISDILMPEMDGFKFCKIIKKDDRFKRIPLIFYTATYVDKQDEEFSLKLGADLFLRKPMQPELLLQEIEKVIDKIKAGDYKEKTQILEEETEIYKLYNSRLIKKLEDKIDQLQEEIEKRKKTEVKLDIMIEEKEILLRELYHRTRNNMQVISSMLKLYSRKIDDTKWDSIINDIDTKINTIALVHKKIYESDDLSHIDISELVEDLISIIKENSAYCNNDIIIETKLEKINVLLDVAISLGFVINELLINSCKHAFKNISDPKIIIEIFRTNDDLIRLKISDNGKGLPTDFSINSKINLGLLLVHETVKNQLQGSIEYNGESGASWDIVFSPQIYFKRI